VDAGAPSGKDFDLIVLGGGGAGLATALFGAIEGLKTLIVEHTSFVGGTTALSAGSLWIPGTEAGRRVNPEDTAANALTYLRVCSAPAGDERMQRRFLEIGPMAVATLERCTEVQLRAFERHPDYLSDREGATSCGRVLEALPYDGRLLGADIDLIRPPIEEFTLLDGMMVDRADISHLLNATRSWQSFRHTAKLMARHTADRMRGRRSTRLVMGNALVGRLLASLRKYGVLIWRETEVLAFTGDRSRVSGVLVRREGREIPVGARAGVVLAGGGFIGNDELRERFFPKVSSFAPGAPTRSGRLIELALGLGARLGVEGHGHAFWAPVSVRTRRDGSRAVFPHFVLDRAKPGTLVVDQTGRRFLNESTSYNLFAKAMIAAHAERPSIPAFLIADHRAVTKYGLGMIKPGGWGLRRSLGDGYLVRAPTIEQLAALLDIDCANLADSVSRINAFARTGIDEDFRRGTTVYERNLGDPAAGPNPTLGRIEHPPFYAIKLYPGETGTSTGLLTDQDARVVAEDGPIAGLFAVGNDMHSIMAGAYPGPGITLGPAVTFAHVAAKAAARKISAAADRASNA
jgi:succinate dehydrogenase/fumarate reductase flavoprotein subunit